MLRSVSFCRPGRLAAIVPAMPDDRICVMLTGRAVDVGCADREHGDQLGRAPCASVRCDLPIFSPTVTTMRFQPIVVPRPSAAAYGDL